MNKWLSKLIALAEICQGLFALYFLWVAASLVRVIRQTEGWSVASWTMQCAFYFAFAALATTAGVLLWRDRPLGLRLSVLVQALQVPQFVLPPFAYSLQLLYGFWIFVHLGGDGLVGFTANLAEADITLSTNSTATAMLGVNLIALWLLRQLWRARQLPSAAERAAAERKKKLKRERAW